MKKNMKRSLCLLCSVMLFLLLFAFSVSAFARGEESGENEQLINTSTYGTTEENTMYILLQEQSYALGEEIPISAVLETDSPVESFNCTYDGFEEEASFYAETDNVIGSIICNPLGDEAHFNITVTLENGAELEADLFGYIANNTVYLSTYSMFCAKDVYWAEMLNSGQKTKTDYETYITGRTPTVSLNTTQIGNGSASTMATTYNVTISGTITWKDDWNATHPLQYTKVIVMDEGGGLLGLWDTELGTAYTNSEGYYSLSFTNQGECNPYLKIYPEGANTVVKTSSGNDYVRQTVTYTGVTTGKTINDTIDMGGDVGKAFQVSQAVITASKFVDAVYGDDLDLVTVKYPWNENNNQKCYYKSNEKTIYIVGNRTEDKKNINGIILRSYASWDVLQHEFFHHVQHQLGIIDSPGGWHGVDTNMYEHYISHHSTSPDNNCVENGSITCANPSPANAKDYAIKLAYAEAVATVLAEIAQDYLVNEVEILDSSIKTVGDGMYTVYNNVEPYEYENPGVQKGEVNEKSVIAVLWDIFDDTVETNDKISLGYQSFWNAILRNNSKTLSQFVAAFYSTYPDYKDELGKSLSYYKIAPQTSGVRDSRLYNLPTFSLTKNGSESTKYQNNSFTLVFFNLNVIYYDEILRIDVGNTTSYTLTETEWNTILSDEADDFYWCVIGSQDDGNETITGPYYSEYSRVYKPRGTPLDSFSILENENQNEPISVTFWVYGYGDYTWYEFVAPTSGIYTFYTESQIDTYGDLFAKPIYGLSTNGRLAYNDDGGQGLNFSITYELDYYQSVFIRVRGYGDASGEYQFFAKLNEHVCHYNVECIPNENSDTHRCVCNCGEYVNEEHNWVGYGDRIRCIDCMLTVVGSIPGGSISSIGDDEPIGTETYAIIPEVMEGEDEE